MSYGDFKTVAEVAEKFDICQVSIACSKCYLRVNSLPEEILTLLNTKSKESN